MNLRHMEVFRAVMLTGGVGGAAELLHVSQPAVSKLLAHAARQSGLTLFERVKGRLVPTPEARALHAEIESAWRGVERVQSVSRSLAHPEAGSLRLAVSASLAPGLVPQAVARLYEQLPQLRVHLEILVAPIMTDALLDHSADLGVALMPNAHPNLVAARKYECGWVCVVPEAHPLARKRLIRPADLVGERLIGSPPGTAYGQSLIRAYGASIADAPLALDVRSSATACWLAQAGAGVAVVDEAVVAGRSFTGLVVKPYASSERLSVRLVRNRYRPLSVVQKAFCVAFDEVWQRYFGAGR